MLKSNKETDFIVHDLNRPHHRSTQLWSMSVVTLGAAIFDTFSMIFPSKHTLWHSHLFLVSMYFFIFLNQITTDCCNAEIEQREGFYCAFDLNRPHHRSTQLWRMTHTPYGFPPKNPHYGQSTNVPTLYKCLALIYITAALYLYSLLCTLVTLILGKS